MIFDVIFDVTMTSKSFRKSKYPNSDINIVFLTWKYVTIQIFSSIWSFVECSSIISLDFWLIFWYLTSYLTSQWGLSPSESHNIIIMTSPTVFPSQNTYPYAFWDQYNHFIEFSGVLDDIRTILGLSGDLWRHKMGPDFKIFNF